MLNKIINNKFNKVKFKDHNKEIYHKTLKINFKYKNRNLKLMIKMIQLMGKMKKIILN
jgi:hypothetical protein